MAKAGDCWWFAPAPAKRKAAQLRLSSWHQSFLNGHHTISLAVDSFKSPTDRRQPHAFPGPTDSDGNQGVSRAGFSSFAVGERRHPVGFCHALIVFQIVMFGAALLAAVPSKWVRLTGFLLLLAGMFITGFSVGMFYLPTFFVFVWVMVRDEPPAVQPGQEGPGK